MNPTRASNWIVPALCLVLAAATSTPAEGSSRRAAGCDGTWHVQAAPEGHHFQELVAATAISGSQAWAVGAYAGPGRDTLHPLVDTWNGTGWVEAPVEDRPSGILYGVDAVSPSDAWAVGRYIQGTIGLTLAEHWDGSTWTVIHTPSPRKSPSSSLDAVAAISTGDVWAVGTHSVTNGDKALVVHWNGVKWRRVKVPNPPGDDTVRFTAVTAVSSTDVWAIGWRERQSDRIVHTLAEHWDGTAWTIVPTPNASINSNEPTGASAVAPDDVWMAGTYLSDSGNSYYPLAEHWDGSAWTIVPTAEPDLYRAFGGIAATSSALAWAVGGQPGVGGPTQDTLVERWDSSTWATVASENPGSAHSSFSAVTAASANRAWAVGTYVNNNDSVQYALIEQYC